MQGVVKTAQYYRPSSPAQTQSVEPSQVPSYQPAQPAQTQSVEPPQPAQPAQTQAVEPPQGGATQLSQPTQEALASRFRGALSRLPVGTPASSVFDPAGEHPFMRADIMSPLRELYPEVSVRRGWSPARSGEGRTRVGENYFHHPDRDTLLPVILEHEHAHGTPQGESLSNRVREGTDPDLSGRALAQSGSGWDPDRKESEAFADYYGAASAVQRGLVDPAALSRRVRTGELLRNPALQDVRTEGGLFHPADPARAALTEAALQHQDISGAGAMARILYDPSHPHRVLRDMAMPAARAHPEDWGGTSGGVPERPASPAEEMVKTQSMRWRGRGGTMQDPITMVAVGAAFSDMPPFVFEKIGKLVAHISNTVALSRIPPLDPYLGFSKEAMSVMEFLASPEVLAGAGGAGLGALGAHLAVDKADPQRGTKILLSGLGGGALGSGVAHAFSRGSSSSRSRAGAEKKESPSPAKEPEARLEGIPAEVRTPESQSTRAAIPAAEVEPRLRSSEQQIRQQATQQQQQQAVQMAAQREQANLLKDQGRVQARIRHILSPQTTAQPSSGPRNLVVGPGGRTLFQRGQQPPQGVLQASGGRGQSKMAQDLQGIYRWVADNSEAAATLGGGVIEKIGKRRMLIQPVLGEG